MTNIGDLLGGRYRIVRSLGAGGCGEVYLAKDRILGKYWAVKEIGEKSEKKQKPGRSGKTGKSERTGKAVYGEMSVLKKLYHPALPQIVDIIRTEQKMFVVMDYVEGENLENLLKRQGVFSPEQVLNIGIQLCRVLVYLHSRKPAIVYRDLKPANVIMQNDGIIKLVDFGTVYQKGKQKKQDCLGTPGFAAPEQYHKKGRPCLQTDVYSLGVTLHYLLTGHDPALSPHKVKSILSWNSQFPKELNRVIQKCTRRQKCFRYKSVGQVLLDLQKISTVQ